MSAFSPCHIKYDNVRVTGAFLPHVIGIWPCFLYLEPHSLVNSSELLYEESLLQSEAIDGRERRPCHQMRLPVVKTFPPQLPNLSLQVIIEILLRLRLFLEGLEIL